MALTVAFDGTVVNSAETTTDWFEDGALPAPEQWGEVLVQGNASIGSQSSNKDGVLGYLSGTTFNFSTTSAGMHVFMWVGVTTKGILDNIGAAPAGLAIRLYSGGSLTNWAEWDIAGADNYSIISNGVDGFTLLVLDPTTTPTRTNGSWSSTAVDRFGVWAATQGSARADNIFIDQILVGNGLKITGSSVSEGWAEVLAEDMGTRANRWGILQGTAGSELLAHGKITIGDDSGTLSTTFSDEGKAVKFISQQYRTSGGTFANMVADDFLGINIVDNATGSTQFTDGVLVGTDQGRSGSKFEGSNLHTSGFYADALTNAASFIKLYSTQLKKFNAGIVYHNDSDSLFYGGTIDSSDQFEPNGSAVLRNLTISGYTGTAGAMLWAETINIQNSKFIANTDGTNNPAAIEHPSAAGTPYAYQDLLFSGNDFDGINTSGTNITVNLNGTSNASSDTGANTITYSATKSLTFIDLPNGVEVTIRQGSFILFHVQNSTDGDEVYSYNYSGDKLVTLSVGGSGYVRDTRLYTLKNADTELAFALNPDPSYLA